MPATSIPAADATELASLLRFLARWLAADPARLAGSLLDYADHPEYGISHLRHDLNRFARLLTGNDGMPGSDPDSF
jgi:hypothetical protein